MKQLLQTIWNFVRRIPKRVTKFIQHKNRSKMFENDETKQPQVDVKPPKEKRKRKSFKSFIHEEQQSRLIHQKSQAKRRRFKRRKTTAPNQSFNSQKAESSIMGSSSEFTQKINPNAPNWMQINSQSECEAIFQDNNGIQISMIDEGKINEESEIKDSDSEVELIKLISGERHPNNIKLPNNQHKQPNFADRFKKKEKIEWWQRIVEGKNFRHEIKNESVEEQESDEKQICNIANGLSVVQITERSRSKSKLAMSREKTRRHRIKVINLIDLVKDEDFPKLYQIPLSVKVYD